MSPCNPGFAEAFVNKVNPVAIDLSYYNFSGPSPFASARRHVFVICHREAARVADPIPLSAYEALRLAKDAEVGRCKTEGRVGGSAVYVEMTDRGIADQVTEDPRTRIVKFAFLVLQI